MSLVDGRVIYRFEGFILDLVRGELLAANGGGIRLRRKSFDLLRLFVENAGRLLDRDTINRAIWSEVTVTDDGIIQCIRDIRRALGDDAQQKLRTVLRRGYIFTLEVTRDPLDQPATNVLPLPDKPSIAVLAFANLTGDPDQEFFSDGFSDNLITELSRNHSLFVIARTSSFIYKVCPIDIRQVGRNLGVRYAIEGSVQRSGSRIRITAQLIDTLSGAHIWAERFDRDLTNLFAVQDEIVHSMIAEIDPAIAQVERQRAMQKSPADLSGWEAWQRALWHWSKGDDLATRRDFLQRAIALNPDFAPARAMMVWLYLSESTRGTGRPLQESVKLADVEARAAIDLDRHSSTAHAALAWVLDARGDWQLALEEAEIATSLNPNDPQGFLIKGHILALSGRPAEARAPLELALRLDPHGPTAPAAMHNLAVGFYFARDYLAVEVTTRRTIQTYPEHPRSFLWLTAALGQLGRSEEARAALHLAIRAAPSYFKCKTDSRAPYMRPEDHEHLLDGLHKADWKG
jgi:adenylate cyclase